MLYSKLFGKTIKESPKDATLVSHKSLYKAGFIRESTAGRYYLLPLGIRVQQRIQKVIKEEMDKAEAQELITPILHPKTLWQETNRASSVGFELMSIKDRNEMEFVLGGTAEEMLVDLVRKFQISYKDLPFHLYQFSTKFRDELRARGGLLRLREFVMKDGYSFHPSEEDFKLEYEKMKNTYSAIFKRLGLNTLTIESDNGYIGGEYSHEFVVESEIGESKFLMDDEGYCAHEDVAEFDPEKKNMDEVKKELIEVDAVRGNTMEDGSSFHKLPMWQQIKDLMMVDERGNFILAVLRGDLEVNEVKLAHAVQAYKLPRTESPRFSLKVYKKLQKTLSSDTTNHSAEDCNHLSVHPRHKMAGFSASDYKLRHATEEEIRSLGSEPGFISPVGISKKVKVVGDYSLKTIKNAYGGANKKNKDYLNINIDRDYKLDIEADIALAKEGYLSKNNQPLVAKKGIEVGNIFQLGFHYSSLMKGANFRDKDGKEKPYYMGCYGIGLARTMAAIVEVYHDEKGIIWPESVAPYQVYLVGLDLENKAVKEKAEEVYKLLTVEGVEVLFDDRVDVSAGAKFADADLIGIPYRIVVSKKTQDKLEIKKRSGKETEFKTLEQLIAILTSN